MGKQTDALLAGNLIMQNPLEWPALRAEVHALVDELHAYKAAAPLCEKHKPDGGARGACLVCGIEILQASLSRISYMCGLPNEMAVSEYDTHYSERAVEKQVADVIEQLSELVTKASAVREFAARLLVTHEHRDEPTAYSIVDSVKPLP